LALLKNAQTSSTSFNVSRKGIKSKSSMSEKSSNHDATGT